MKTDPQSMAIPKVYEQIFAAAVLGTTAFKNGISCVPCLDAELMQMLKGRSVGEVPECEASSVKIMQEWTNAWTLASLAASA